ncbi:TPA: hypothetical protein ACOEBO_001488 [Enterobacter cloacae]
MSKITKELAQSVSDLKAGYTLGHTDVAILNELARIALASLEAEKIAEPVAKVETVGVCWYADNGVPRKPAVGTELYSAPPAPVSVPDDYFASLVAAARVRANKAMRKFPQPNYVLNKVAEESGEVIKAVIHFTEGREEWRNVEGEIIDNLAMLIRLVMEGDQVIGFTPPDACRAAMLQGADGNSQVIPDGLRLALSNAGIAAPESDEMLYATHEKYVQMLVDWAKDRKPFKSVVIPDAYDIESFGIFSATEGENGLILQIELFRFGTGKCQQIGKENMVPKFALQAIINRLQEHCDSMGNEALVDILSTPAEPQQDAE